MEWQEFHQFWFGDTLTGGPLEPQVKRWFEKDERNDQEIRTKFAPLLTQPEQLRPWKQEPRGILSLVILYDQVPRNSFRGTKEAYAYDDKALALARELVPESTQFHLLEQLFLFLPFQHSESLEDQEISLSAYRRLKKEAELSGSDELKNFMTLSEDFALKHFEAIKKFGRFPHRNRILGRESTSEEIEYLKNPQPWF